ncbi:MAG TPA: DivIVA domain-containing protein [Acidimicrobiales bacterium]|nr:DivIVA domain-containing protein [Acidimicrobiales bacterium]
MAGDLPRPSTYPVPLSPDELRRHSFTNSFRGFDPGQVRELLDAVAVELERLIRSEEALRAELREARQSAASPRLDEATLTAALGNEAAQILHSAHEASAELRKKAEENSTRVLREAQQAADSLRASSEGLLSERTAEAESSAEAIRAGAQAEAQAIVTRAREQAEAALIEARARFDAMSEEAEALKARVLGELTRRRRNLVAQLEQLGAGRDSMLQSVGDVRRLIDQVTGSVEGLELEAKAAADNALDRARRSPDAEEPVLEELAQTGLGAASLGAPPPPPEVIEVTLSDTVPPVRIHAQMAGTRELPPTRAVLSAEPLPPGPVLPPPPPGHHEEPVPPAPAVLPRGWIQRTERAPAPESPPEPEPVPERRMSSLRILRRREERFHPSETGPPAVPEEGIRIIRPSPAAEATAPDPDGPSPLSSVPPTDPPAAVSASPAPAPPVSEAAAPSVSAGSVREDGGIGQVASERPSVDELFARLRAEREAARRDADAVFSELSRPGVEDGTPVAEPRSDRPEAEGPRPEAVLEPPPDPLDEDDTAAGQAALVDAAAQDSGAAPSLEGSALEESQEDWLERRNQMLGPVHDRLARKLKRTLQDDQNDLLDRVRSSANHPHLDPLPPEAEHTARFAAAAVPILGEAFERGSEFARSALPGVSGGDTGAGHVQSVARALAADLVGDLRIHLGRAVAEPGFDEAGLADLVGSAYRSWKGARVEALAMDHLVAAFERAVLASVPSGARLVWIVDDDGGPCPDCDDNGLAGATPAGSEYPTGQTHPPAHPGCRCLLVPALT